ncbi:LacI family transcriptional regulator [Salmonella enterica subsp. enterica serovar Namur str. 05-2929]|uniref:Substrate-binding domain-containing protein n=2 Tax=Salmonella enterica I TaxID=59201 RepID=A0A3V2D6Q7_SALET|nr:LacI family DNA-binding transcriptional regulator [Salmonella enterica]EAA7108164.1 LacI family DNA-binding transcriptional regulator [Salmonella enterica subsp. enterica serovar Ouagadougou]EBP6613634.1 substrate-binding domain-containing protein [Salmonella enterica subsp. enterica]EBR9511334.1 LacI family DNA-binding transcriptional regulator [Salmonella enterica subsp. enterica serovar Ouagadougou]EBV0635996.1 LacI family DNA-binding transcriptional regulator [Salmonella enterica subsp. 
MAKTIEEIATDLNISITTVRLVLNKNADKYRISQKTQQKINDYIALHGYVLNHTARSLKLNKTEVLGLIIPRLSNPYFSHLAECLELKCLESGYQLMTCCTYSDSEREIKLVESLLSRNVDGLFIAPASLRAQKHHLKRSTKPIVILDRDFGSNEVSVVISDNAAASEKLTTEMIKNGAVPYLFLTGDDKQPSIKERIRGYRNAMVAAGLKASKEGLLNEGHNSIEDGKKIMSRYLEKNEKLPESLITSSLPLLEGALSVISEKYGIIPADLNIGTFDTHPMLKFLPNRIWTAQQNEEAIVQHAFDAMMSALKGSKEIRHEVVPMVLNQYVNDTKE